MIKTIKKIILSCISVLGVSLFVWILFILNPSLSYAHKTQFDYVTVYHNNDLEINTEKVINKAIGIIKNSQLFDESIHIELCLNDDKIYPKLNPLVNRAIAYALLDKTVIKNCTVQFNEERAQTKWAINEHELREFNLSWILAHEFMHNLQFNADLAYVIKSTMGNINWKLEGHAEYISRGFKNDNALKSKIDNYLIQERKAQGRFPVFKLNDGTMQILSYYKYALIVQYLTEEKHLTFDQICALKSSQEKMYDEMLSWYREA